ncbi:MAG TPA: hypothetical protein VIS10_09915 [Anaerolineales bacterium]
MSFDWKNITFLATDAGSLFGSHFVETLVNRGESAPGAEREVTLPLYALMAEVDVRAVVSAAREALGESGLNQLDFM